MKKEVNWLQLVVVLTIVLLATFTVIGAEISGAHFTDDKTGKLSLEIVGRPTASPEPSSVENENG